VASLAGPPRSATSPSLRSAQNSQHRSPWCGILQPAPHDLPPRAHRARRKLAATICLVRHPSAGPPRSATSPSSRSAQNSRQRSPWCGILQPAPHDLPPRAHRAQRKFAATFFVFPYWIFTNATPPACGTCPDDPVGVRLPVFGSSWKTTMFSPFWLAEIRN
jgi:hypothetical protein